MFDALSESLDGSKLLLPFEPEVTQGVFALFYEIDATLEKPPQGLVMLGETTHKFNVVSPCHNLLTIRASDIVLHEVCHSFLILDLIGFNLRPIKSEFV